MLLAAIDLHEVNESVWTSMLGLELVACEPAPDLPGETYLFGSVTISGACDAAVMVQLPLGMARHLAATMFGQDEESIGEEEIFDALGEMANMVGGNVKGALPGDSKLSLPTVVEGRNFRWASPGADPVTDLSYQCQAWTVRTVMFERVV